MKKLSLFVLLLALLFSFTSCGSKEPTPEELFNQNISSFNTNLATCTNIVYSTEIKSGEILLADIEKEVMINGSDPSDMSLTVITTENVLGSDFTIQKQTYSEYIDGALPSQLFNYNFAYSDFATIEVSNEKISGTIPSANVDKVLNTDVNNTSDLTVEITYSEGKITGYTFSYSTDNNNSVVITASYSY